MSDRLVGKAKNLQAFFSKLNDARRGQAPLDSDATRLGYSGKGFYLTTRENPNAKEMKRGLDELSKLINKADHLGQYQDGATSFVTNLKKDGSIRLKSIQYLRNTILPGNLKRLPGNLKEKKESNFSKFIKIGRKILHSQKNKKLDVSNNNNNNNNNDDNGLITEMLNKDAGFNMNAAVELEIMDQTPNVKRTSQGSQVPVVSNHADLLNIDSPQAALQSSGPSEPDSLNQEDNETNDMDFPDELFAINEDQFKQKPKDDLLSFFKMDDHPTVDNTIENTVMETNNNSNNSEPHNEPNPSSTNPVVESDQAVGGDSNDVANKPLPSDVADFFRSPASSSPGAQPTGSLNDENVDDDANNPFALDDDPVESTDANDLNNPFAAFDKEQN